MGGARGLTRGAGCGLPPGAGVLPAAAFCRPPLRHQSRPSAEAAASANGSAGRRKALCYWPTGGERPAQSARARGVRQRGGTRAAVRRERGNGARPPVGRRVRAGPGCGHGPAAARSRAAAEGQAARPGSPVVGGTRRLGLVTNIVRRGSGGSSFDQRCAGVELAHAVRGGTAAPLCEEGSGAAPPSAPWQEATGRRCVRAV